jgi:hypothetical protein
LLKRSLRGTYVAVEPFHLDSYVTEHVFRYNNCATKDNPLTDAEIMATFAYVDDSGSEPSQPLYVLGGLILPEDTWKIFSDDWKHVLHSDPIIDYFKASEVWDKEKGPFKEFTTKQRSGKVDALADIISTYRPLSISARVEWSVFRGFSERYKLDDELNDPYFFLFFSLISQVVILGNENARFANVNFVFDKQGRVGVHARLWYAVLHTYCSNAVRALLGQRPDSADEQNELPLQGADMFAWYQRRSVLGNLGHESHQRVWDIFKTLHCSIVLEDDNLQRIADDLCFPIKE